MALNRLACPACGAAVHSAAGFAAGQAVNCPKCESEFTVDEAAIRSAASAEAADDFVPGKPRLDEDPEWSYRNSSLRYAVLGVLLVVLVVLGYLLYDKKMKERQAASGSEEGRGIPPAVVPNEMLPLPGDPVAAGGRPVPKTEIDPIAASKARLVGAWEAKAKGETYTLEYKADGSFLYTVETEGKAGKPVVGRWDLAGQKITMPRPMVKTFVLDVVLTPEGQSSLKESAKLNSNGTLEHPLIDREFDGKRPSATFVNKNRPKLVKEKT